MSISAIRPSRRYAKTTIAVALLTALAAFQPPVLAVHDEGLFELGNGVNPTVAGSADILGSGGQPGPDWADIFDASGNVVNLFGGVTATFLRDNTSQSSAVDDTVFGSGSAKNNDDPTSWTWDAGNVPAKDDLANSYAYAKVNPGNGHLIVYVGMERIDASGDSHLDIEFFQDEVGLDELSPCNDPGNDPVPCHFVGDRTHDDLLVSMDYTRGGGLGSLVVHLWNATANEYDEVETVTGEGCNGVAAANLTSDSVCGFNNGGNINGGPWPNFDRHGAVITLIPRNGFTEFALDMTAAAGGDTPCISTILAKSRSSQSFTAELKDFAGPFPFDICGGEIDIVPDDVNAVGQPHTFLLFVNGTVAGVGGAAPDGTFVTVNLTASNGASVSPISNTCASPGTVGGVCSVTFTSPTAGRVTGHANVTFTSGGIAQSFQTDGTGTSSVDAVKRFVDARIQIGPTTDTNSVEETHTFQVNVTVDNGTGAGFVPLTVGHATVVLTPSGGATPVVNATASTCDDAGDNLDALGQCTVVFTSATTGTVVGHANITFAVDGVTLARETDGVAGNSGDATKLFVAGSFRWTKLDNAGALLGGAVFTVCRTHVFNSSSGLFQSVPITCQDVLDNAPPDVNATAGGFRLAGLPLGRYTVQEKTPPPGFVLDPANRTVDLSTATSTAVISTPFRDERPIVKLAGFGYENAPTVSPTAGVVTGQTNYTIRMHNYGTATAVLAAFLNVTGNAAFLSGTGTGLAAPASGTSCVAMCAISWTGVTIAPGANATLVARITYTGAADGSVIAAQLASSYTTAFDAFQRTPSGTPASVAFTVQAD